MGTLSTLDSTSKSVDENVSLQRSSNSGRMTLQRRLTITIIAILSLIMFFFILTTVLFRDIERFIDRTLTPDIRAARLYERFGDVWNQIDDQLTDNLSDFSRRERLIDEATYDKLQNLSLQLETLLAHTVHHQTLIELLGLVTSYNNKLKELEYYNRRRYEILQRESQKRLVASKAITTRTIELTGKIKRMNEELPRTLDNPEFRQMLGSATNLLTAISRIEKDLQIVQAEIELYVAHKMDSTKSTGRSGALPERIQSRLQAVLGLLSKSIEDSKSALHTRVFDNIKTNLADFKKSFIELRELLEHSDSERLELDDLMAAVRKDMSAFFNNGQAIIAREAEKFWNRIHETSANLIANARRAFNTSLIFLFVALIGGIYIAFVFPKRIAAPLNQLRTQMNKYRLGDEPTFVDIASDTEEIYALAKSFYDLAHTLHNQAESNKTYLKTIQKLAEIYAELESDTAGLGDSDKGVRLENAVGKVLELLKDTLPGIGLVKVMRKVVGENGTPIGFIRLGPPQFTQEFLSSSEYFPYAASTGLPADPRKEVGKEFLPFHEGLTGWYYDNKMLGIQASDDSPSFFQPTIPLPAIRDNPILRGRTYEQGLNGCLLLLPLVKISQGGDALLFNDPDYEEILFVYFPNPDTKLSLQDIAFLRIIADQLASIVETDKLMTAADKQKEFVRQLKMAKEIQENLLPPKAPQIPGLFISCLSKPADEVGGDYYDFFELGPSRLGVVVADAAGKNVPAAIIMTVLKTTLSTMELKKMSAGDVLTQANTIIQHNITEDRFITAIYAIVDAASGEVELACAGHNPAIVVARKNGSVLLEEKSALGPPLGIVSMIYQSVRFKLSKDSILVLYTDGVTEARNIEKEQYGLERLKRFLASTRKADLASELLKDIKLFTGDASQYDDITVVAVEFKGEKV